MLRSAAALAIGTGAGMARAEVPPAMTRPGRGVDAAPYGLPSPHEKSVVRRLLPRMFSTPLSAVSFTPLADLEGVITPNGLHFVRHHAGAPDIAPQSHRLLIHGLVKRPTIFRLDDLRRFPIHSRICFIECAGNGAPRWRGPTVNAVRFTHGMLSCSEWTGVRLMDVLEYCGLQDGAAWLLTEGADAAGFARSLPLELAEEALLAFAQNGEAIRPEQGYPLRLVVPGVEGAAHVKWLHRIEVGDKPWMTREETARYADLRPDGKADLFTFVQEVNSVITSPSPERPLPGKGVHQLSGLAWSGHGLITAVDVSFDGGMNWRPARLQQPVLPKSLTRFRLPVNWRGEQWLLQSRAVDEKGNVQPTLAANRRLKGETGIYHNNSITTWRVAKDGTVRHVEVD